MVAEPQQINQETGQKFDLAPSRMQTVTQYGNLSN